MIEAVWMTTRRTGVPHCERFSVHNPGIRQHVHYGPDCDTEEGRKTAWRNCDRNIRDWRKTAKSDASHFLILEWDVWVDCPIREKFPVLHDFQGKDVKRVGGKPWQWFGEISRLPVDLQSHAIGIAPLAVLLLSRNLLDAISRPEYDEVFARDIFCELRLPTVAAHAGFKIEGNPLLFDVRVKPRAPEEGSICHAVKGES